MRTPLLANLNPEQLAAVTLPHASALILAGAGSGKTRVLTTRIAWLLATGQASPLSILAVTFTNKAAKEMLIRLSALTPVNTRGMWVGTFHGLCNRMLRAHYRDANLPQLFQIIGHAGPARADQAALPRAQHRRRSLSAAAAAVRSSRARRKRACARTWSRRATTSRARQVEHYALYEAMCQREGVVDFAELLLRSYRAAGAHDEHARALPAPLSRTCWSTSSRTRNVLQYKWLRLLRRTEHRGVRRRRRRPVDLRVPRRQRRQHAALRARFRDAGAAR